jgi:3-isopropylmalate dehydratase small subunit
MRAFRRIEGGALVMPGPNIDTDQILPKQFLRTTERKGLGKAMFYDLRFDQTGSEIAGNPFDRDDLVSIVAGENFGCGSSREHAAWALDDYGIRCVIAPSFAEIFSSNCANCGILLIALDPRSITALAQEVAGGGRLAIDLEKQEIQTPAGRSVAFAVDPRIRRKLLGGLDEIAETELHLDAIARFEAKRDDFRSAA